MLARAFQRVGRPCLLPRGRRGRPPVLPPPPPPPPPVDPELGPYIDARLNKAYRFQQFVLGLGTTPDDLHNGKAAIRAYVGAPAAKADLPALVDASALPSWSETNKRINAPSAGATYEAVDVPGFINGSTLTGPLVVRDSYLGPDADGTRTLYKINQTGSNDRKVVVENSILAGHTAAAIAGSYTAIRVTACDGSSDGFKGDDNVYLENCWVERLAMGNPSAHCDPWQISDGSNCYGVNVVAWIPDETSSYRTEPVSYGLTGYFFVHANTGKRKSEGVGVFGGLSCFGSYYPIRIGPQSTDSRINGVIVAHLTLAPDEFRGSRALGNDTQIDAYFTAGLRKGGELLNVIFKGNKVGFTGTDGHVPLQIKQRDGTFTDADGIWHYHKPSLTDPGNPHMVEVFRLARELGIVDANGDPLPGMLKSHGGVIEDQQRTHSATASTPLGLDLSRFSEATTFTLYIPAGQPLLEYVKDAN